MLLYPDLFELMQHATVFKSVTVEVGDLSAFGYNKSPTRHTQPMYFTLKWQIISKELLFLNTVFILDFHVYSPLWKYWNDEAN